MRSILLNLMLLFLILFSCQKSMQPVARSVEGVWKVVTLHTITPQGKFTNTDPQPGLFIFTREYYSMVWMPRSVKLPDNKQIWQPTDQEKVDQFNSIIVNSGSYTFSDSLLTTIPLVAKTPEFIGGKATYRWSFKKDTLSISVLNIYSHNGIPDEGAIKYRTTIKLLRLE
jgi:hypothetical protein